MNAVRNKDGIFINTEVFREEAKHFLKYGYYCPDAWGSPAWIDYWQEQLDRCRNGYSSGGVKITGHHYAYLNFGQIKVSKEFKEVSQNELVNKELAYAQKHNKSTFDNRQSSLSKKRTGSQKIVTFPDFWSLDYNYFHIVDIARWGTTIKELEKLGLEVTILPDYLNGGYHLIIAKSRRKGFSYKNGFIAANTYNTIRDSVTIIGAFDTKYLYPEGTMKMASDYLNFFNEHTGWVKARDYVDKVNHKKASYSDRNEAGIVIEKGYKSQIIAVSFKDNPDAAIGKDGTLVLFEEGGKFNNLKEAFLKTRPAMEDGIYTTGQIIVYGTSGDMDAGTIDFAEMFYSPQAYKLLPFRNIWDESAGVNAVSGMFVPDYWNKPGFIDENGNSDNKAAKEYEIQKRKEIIKHSVGTKALSDYISQFPFSPEEAFSTASTNDFPVVELRKQLAKVRANNLFLKKGQAVTLYREEGKVKMKPDLRGELNPIAHYPVKDTDITGAVVIFEAPIENAPHGLYKMGYDPYRQDQSSGVSLGACYVYKSRNKFSYTGDTIVAEYVGRPESAETFHRNVMLLAELYHCQVMYENEVPDVKTYFKNQHKLHLLAAQPDGVISKHIKNSKVSRIYGIHMNAQLKDAGAKYIKKWLLTERDYDENGNKILNLETIYSPALLEELISFNMKDNFDRVMAFMQVMFQIEEDNIKEYTSRSRGNHVAESLRKLFANKPKTLINYG